MNTMQFGKTLDKVLELMEPQKEETFEQWLARACVRAQAVLVVRKERIEKESN